MESESIHGTGLLFKYSKEYLALLEEHKRVMGTDSSTLHSLQVLTALIEWNPSNYTVWVTRRAVLAEVVERTEYSMEEELQWIRETAQKHQKNYQVWHHFGYVVQKLRHDVLADCKILELAEEEPKNIHFWGFFLSSVRSHCSLPRALEYTQRFIEDDVRNNSVYSIRHTILTRLVESEKSLLEEEKAFLLRLPLLRNNPAFWNYVKALEREHPTLGVLQACQAMIQERDITPYYED
ncbi:protein farnesyltransferase/geranylgeranyltransferase type-1 subunit alpha [Nematocida sp. AWRm77]|nr:protein farnesyltransferase/geranylgeranyltransferase type-1 subunit alpha [Nematocida sp. AWRm77]